MWTVFFLGLCLGVVLAMVWFIFQIRRWQKAHEEKDKATMTCYRADVAVAAHDDRKQLEREISNLKGRIRQLENFNRILARAIDNEPVTNCKQLKGVEDGKENEAL